MIFEIILYLIENLYFTMLVFIDTSIKISDKMNLSKIPVSQNPVVTYVLNKTILWSRIEVRNLHFVIDSNWTMQVEILEILFLQIRFMIPFAFLFLMHLLDKLKIYKFVVLSFFVVFLSLV